MNSKSKIKRLLRYIKPYWHLELITFLVMAVIAGLALALPIAVQYLIDDLIPTLSAAKSPEIWPVAQFGLFLIGIYLAQVLFSWIRDYFATYIGANIIADFRSQLFSHLERLSLDFFYKNKIGEIMSRMLSDVNRIQSLLIDEVLVFFTNIFMLLAIVIYLLTIDWVLTVVAIIPVPITIWLTHMYGTKLNVIARKLQETIAALSAKYQESLLMMKIIQAFAREKSELDSADKTMKGLTRLYVKNGVTRSLAVNLVQFVNMLGPIVVLAWGTYLITTGEMKLGALMAFYMLLTYLYSPIQGLAYVHIEVRSAMASVDRIFEYLDIEPKIQEDPNPVFLEKPHGNIRYENVTFSYNPDTKVLEGFNLNIAEGEKIALVGLSGSGKTTVIKLLMRFYDPDSGQITLDGIDLRRLSLNSLRTNIGLVDQDPLLFSATIFENIRYSKPDAGESEIIEAARIANIHDFISKLPDGYQTPVGERGLTLSGGEKQRICLARAVLKDPKIMILDEATSALDSKSEKLIQNSLKTILQDKTALIIAHRLSTVQHADRIIAIDKGRIVAEGRHDELMNQSGLYRELVQSQLSL